MLQITFILPHLLLSWILYDFVFRFIKYKKAKHRITECYELKIRYYYHGILRKALRIAAILLIPLLFPGSFQTAGVNLPLEVRFVVGFVVAGLVLVFIPVTKEGKLSKNYFFIPRTIKERRTWVIYSLFIGTEEELCNRAFLFFYLHHYFPDLSLGLILVITSVFFGIAHLYQGLLGVVFTSYFGAVMGLLYIITGSIIPSITVHALWNINLLNFWEKATNEMDNKDHTA
ncbi:MAG: CPBP family intramembrane metalloprotease [Dehalobacter sp.]|nr:CPBP family intramembrane metalloprotease [Dehalobacter sp.]